MVDSLKKNFSPLPASKYGKSTKRSRRHHQEANEVMGAYEADTVRAFGVLGSLWFKKNLAVEKPRGNHFLSNDEKEKWT